MLVVDNFEQLLVAAPFLYDCGDFVIDGEGSTRERGKDFFDRDGNYQGAVVNSHFLGKLANRETGLTVREEGSVTLKIDQEKHGGEYRP
jgi:hypothetical protein